MCADHAEFIKDNELRDNRDLRGNHHGGQVQEKNDITALKFQLCKCVAGQGTCQNSTDNIEECNLKGVEVCGNAAY